MQFSDMVTRCETRFRDANHDIITADQWKSYLNDAYADVQAATDDWPWMETTSTSLSVSAGSRSVDLPTDVYRVLAVLNTTDDVVLQPFEGRDQHFRQYPDQDEQGTPRVYRVFGYTLEVYPLPTGATALKVEYLKSASELSADSDVPVFPAQWHRVLVEGALARAYVDDANPDMAQAYDTSFTALLTSMKNTLLGSRQSRYSEIVDTWWE